MSGTGPIAAAPPARPPELQDWLNSRLYHPLAGKLARMLVGTIVTPNALSLFGGGLVVLAGWLYTLPGWPLTTALALLLHMAWHVTDGADGDLARLTGKASPNGEVVDGMSDYFSHIIVYVMFGYLLAEAITPWLAWLLTWAAGLSRIAQTNHYEVRRRQYQWWVYDRPWLRNEPFRAAGKGGAVMQAIATFYLGLARHLEGRAREIDGLHAAMQADSAAQQRFRASAERQLRPLLGPIGALGSNHRTIVLGASMFAGSPLWFLLYEAVLLNLVLGWSLRAHGRAARAIAREIS